MLFTALIETVKDRTLFSSFRQNILSGVTVGIVALPLSMGLAIASGVPPQHGLYTAIVGGIVIAITGGSRVNISGPTAAFVVVLLPIVYQYGLGGLLISGVLAGVIMIGFGLFRLGKMIEVIPYPVVIGFTSGIGTVIAILQLKDLLGLQIEHDGIHFIEKVMAIIDALPSLQWQEIIIGIITFTTLLIWKKLKSKIPSYFSALILGSFIAAIFNSSELLPQVETISSRFSYDINGIFGQGIPPVLPQFVLPWELAGGDGKPIGLSWEMIHTLLSAAFSIALLGALESLLCAVVADGMTGYKHNPDGELIGQGIGNIAVAFMGGVPATAAIARTATNIRSGGSTPLSAFTHSVVILLTIVVFAKWLGYVPMASIAAVLLMVAWNMSEAHHAMRILTKAPTADSAVFATCFLLTVFIDMQVAVAAGLALASMLFMRRMIELTEASVLDHKTHTHELINNEQVVVYDINGPLFFGAAHKALKILSSVNSKIHTVVLDFADVSLLDTTAMVNLESLVNDLENKNVSIILIHVKQRLIDKLSRFGVIGPHQKLIVKQDIQEAMNVINSMDLIND
ncbi:MAG: C4-dicarboxylic acid transporter DauA [Proteobacteria bacterium]|nr:C4-dicarboxylic acid transporter DauA [Pseudomonadota bacterium]NOG60358.1 C4-dicarboxylic acid transporter DauA [Pseudomonadota bacterium]